MKLKVFVVSLVFWLISFVSGVVPEIVNRNLRNSKGSVEVQKLQDLYDACMFDEVLAECERTESNKSFMGYEPQFLYLRWASSAKLLRIDKMQQCQDMLIERYPKHPLVAQMRFVIAVNLIGKREYSKAKADLQSIQQQFPSASVSTEAKRIVRELSKNHSQSLY